MQFFKKCELVLKQAWKAVKGGFSKVAANVAGWSLQQTIIASVVTFVIVIGAVGGVIAVKNMNKPVEVVQETETEKEVVVVKEPEKLKVTIPSYSGVEVSADSIEHDLNVYFTNALEEKITGTEFAVKLLSAEQYENLKPYVERIILLNANIEAAKENKPVAEVPELAVAEDEKEKAEVVSEAKSTEEKSTEAKTTEVKTTEVKSTEVKLTEEKATESKDKNTTDNTEEKKICGYKESDFKTLTILEQQQLMKEDAIKAYANALIEMDATRLVDDDKDGKIYQKDLADGDFMMCYEPVATYDAKDYAVSVTVKKKIEYKPVENIEKKVEEYDPSKDEQREVHEEPAPPVTDTVEYVNSSQKDYPAVYETSKAVLPKAEVKDRKREVKTITVSDQAQAVRTSEFDSDSEIETQTETGETRKEIWFEAPSKISLFSKLASEIEIKVSGLEITETECNSVDGLAVEKVNEETYKLKASNTSDDKTVTVTFVGKTNGTDIKISCEVAIQGESTQLKDANGKPLFADKDGKTPLTYANYNANATAYCIAKEAYTDYYGWQTFGIKKYYYDKNAKPVTGSQIIQGNLYEFDSTGLLLTGGTGIDVSKWQGDIDWDAAATEISFTIIKCAGRYRDDRDLYIDPKFERNITEAKRVGVQIGLYFYSTALSEAEAIEEASLAIKLANKYGGVTLPIYFDFEDYRQRDGLDRDEKLAICKAFCSTVQAAGYKTGVYSYQYWLERYMDTKSLPLSYSIWVAAPSNDPTGTMSVYTGRYDMWQYRVGDGTCAGIKGAVDVNRKFF